jgi:hypothetical protein
MWCPSQSLQSQISTRSCKDAQPASKPHNTRHVPIISLVLSLWCYNLPGAGLSGVEGQLTRLIIMDSEGGDKARALARALVDIGQPLAYVMEVGGLVEGGGCRG